MIRIVLMLIVAFVAYAHSEAQTLLSFPFLQQLEAQAANVDHQYEKEDITRQLDLFSRHPLNVNEADEEDLKGLVFLNDEQIRNFLLYRKLFGPLISKYELQAIPGWDIALIEKIFPFVVAGETKTGRQSLDDFLTKGDHSILFRMGRSMTKSASYVEDSAGLAKYAGGPYRIFLRYQYNYRNHLQVQWLGDKDAGEQMFRGINRYGFDFNSFHVCLKNMGLVKLLILGDFTVSMGQGLIQWQGISLTKSTDITTVKRESPVIRPYTSSGESEFFRGVGVSLQKNRWEGTVFISQRRVSAHLEKDSVPDRGFVTSLLSSGYHRTNTEIEQKNNIGQFSAGASISRRTDKGEIGINLTMHRLTLPIRKEPLAYNLFSARGNYFFNQSIEFSRTQQNFHFFGEAALDKEQKPSAIAGLMISLSQRFDLSLVGRAMSKAYTSLYASAFTENEMPANERGLYAGLSLRGPPGLLIQAYSDFYFFPWLKYRTNAPSSGREFAVVMNYKPDKKTEINLRYKCENKPGNSAAGGVMVPVVVRIKKDFQFQSALQISKGLSVRNRLEISSYQQPPEAIQNGFLFFTELLYDPPARPWSFNMRMQYFEAGGYDARIYAYENVMSYSFGFPAFYNKGYRGYLNFHRDLSKLFRKTAPMFSKVEAWLRAAGTYYNTPPHSNSTTDSSLPPALDLQLQLMVGF